MKRKDVASMCILQMLLRFSARRARTYVAATDLALQIATNPAPGGTISLSFNAGNDARPFDAVIVPIRVGDGQLLGPVDSNRLQSLAGIDVHHLLRGSAKEAMKKDPVVFFSETGRLILQPFNAEASDRKRELQSMLHKSIQKAAETGAKVVSMVMPGASMIGHHAECDSLIRTAVLSQHAFDRHLTEKPARVQEIRFVDLLGSDQRQSVERIDIYNSRLSSQQLIAEGTILARELANGRSDIVSPEYIEQLVRSMTDALPNGVLQARTIKGTDALRQSGLSMLAAVGQGSQQLPRLVVIEYNPDKKSAGQNRPIALIGKGVTFDTGGLNLKPTGSMEDMHMDMSGAAAVIGAMRTIALLHPGRNVVAALALAENAIGSRAYKPHAILDSAKGSVLVSNTDAEGRLCLADAMSYIQAHHKPSVLIDIATLTGACVVALGEYAAGVFSNDEKLAQDIIECGQYAYERCWRLPILPEHVDELKGKQSDFVSCGKGRAGGACTAAAFLSKFVDDSVRWAHIDIAGPAMYSRAIGHIPQGGTGFGAQLLCDFVLKH